MTTGMHLHCLLEFIIELFHFHEYLLEEVLPVITEVLSCLSSPFSDSRDSSVQPVQLLLCFLQGMSSRKLTRDFLNNLRTN